MLVQTCLVIITACFVLITLFLLFLLFGFGRLVFKTAKAVETITESTNELINDGRKVAGEAENILKKINKLTDGAKYAKIVMDIAKKFKR